MITPRLSFVQFNSDSCTALPVLQGSDIVFFAQTQELFTVSILTDSGVVISPNTIFPDFGAWISLYDIDLSSLAVGTGFRIVLKNIHGTEIARSNCFIKIDDPKYTALVEYGLNESGLGWSCPVDFNKIRLPLHLHEPQYPQNQDIYVDRNGKRRLLYSQIETEYILTTDYLDANTHEKIVALLAHDNVFINDRQVFKSDSYSINWGDKSRLECGEIAQASAKVVLDSIEKNSNCGVCLPITCTSEFTDFQDVNNAPIFRWIEDGAGECEVVPPPKDVYVFIGSESFGNQLNVQFAKFYNADKTVEFTAGGLDGRIVSSSKQKRDGDPSSGTYFGTLYKVPIPIEYDSFICEVQNASNRPYPWVHRSDLGITYLGVVAGNSNKFDFLFTDVNKVRMDLPIYDPDNLFPNRFIHVTVNQ